METEKKQEEKPLVKKITKSDAVVTLSLDLREYSALLDLDSELNRARLIPIFNREKGGAELEQFRIFDIKTGSIYEYLGLRNLDELVAVDGFYLPSSTAFFRYLGYISQYRRGMIEIRRNGRPLVFKYKFR